jgi:hypothetical protein
MEYSKLCAVVDEEPKTGSRRSQNLSLLTKRVGTVSRARPPCEMNPGSPVVFDSMSVLLGVDPHEIYIYMRI